jgi:ribonuclease HI
LVLVKYQPIGYNKRVIIASFDGLCAPVNPGGTAVAGVLAVEFEGGAPIFQEVRIIGEGRGMSTQVAEYTAVIRLMELLQEQGLNKRPTLIRGTSRLVMNQLFGTWEVKKGLYVPLAKIAKSMLKKFAAMDGEFIPEARNRTVMTLVNAEYRRLGLKPERPQPEQKPWRPPEAPAPKPDA